jgi:hypothetical protein
MVCLLLRYRVIYTEIDKEKRFEIREKLLTRVRKNWPRSSDRN